MFDLATRLELDLICNQLIYSYNLIDTDCEQDDASRQRAYSFWKLETFRQFVQSSSSSEIIYVLEKLKARDERVYLQVNLLATEFCAQNNNNHTKTTCIGGIIDYIRGLISSHKDKHTQEKIAIKES